MPTHHMYGMHDIRLKWYKSNVEHQSVEHIDQIQKSIAVPDMPDATRNTHSLTHSQASERANKQTNKGTYRFRSKNVCGTHSSH